MQHLEVSGAVRPLKWSLGVKWLMAILYGLFILRSKYWRHTGQLWIIRNSGDSKARQGPISYAFFMHMATIYNGVYNCSEYSHSCMFNR